ncbi:MAG: ribonuclease HI family protein [Deltaproteobacteria bacterium]|nr:ribonuclease HI family protein [Candidatus Zymogenaceae bacterium]
MSRQHKGEAAALLLRRLAEDPLLGLICELIPDMEKRNVGDLLGFAADTLGHSSHFSTDEVIIHVDGASLGNPGPAGAGAVIVDCHNKKVAEVCEPLGVTTNNVAEYRALILGLRKARELGVRRVHVRADSELMVKQMSGDYRIKDEKLLALSREAKDIIDSFDFFDIQHIDRSENRAADRLSKRAADVSG